jgi:hypothetical protein
LENFVPYCDQWLPLSRISSSNAKGDPGQISVSGVEKKGMAVEKIGRRLTLLIAGVVFSAVAITSVFAQSEPNNSGAPTRKRYLPEYTASGDLVLPVSVISAPERPRGKNEE